MKEKYTYAELLNLTGDPKLAEIAFRNWNRKKQTAGEIRAGVRVERARRGEDPEKIAENIQKGIEKKNG